MELKAGYKQTDLGLVPDNWDLDELETFWTVTDCKHLTAEFVQTGFPVASIRETQAWLVDLSEANHTTEAFYLKLTEGGRKPRPGDLIFSRNATVGEVAQVTDQHPPFAMGQDVCLLRKRSDAQSTDFLQCFLKSKITARQIDEFMVGSTFKRVNVQQIKALNLLMPPPSEQRAIAAALNDVDAQIAALDALIAKKRDIKQAAMQQLLTGKTRLHGFKGEWEKTVFGKVAERIIGGGTPSRTVATYWNGNIPWVTVKDFACHRRFGTLEYITNEGLKNSATHLIPRHTLIISTRMALGKAVIFEVDVTINQDLKAIFLTKDTSISFMYYWFQFNEARIAEMGSGTTVMGLALEDLRKIPFFKPMFPEQSAIASVLSDMDAELAALEAKRDKTRTLKAGMMQELLTGRIRLI